MSEMPLAERILNKLLHGPMQMNPFYDTRDAQDRAVRIIASEIEWNTEPRLPTKREGTNDR